jgi:hypothetical protein
MSNVEGMYSIYFKKSQSDTRRKRLRCASDSTLRNSLFDILRFDTTELVAGCGSLFKFIKFHTSAASGRERPV